MARLAGKVAAVTGGAVGIGKAAVQRMVEEGAAVGILDVLDQAGKALATELAAKGYKVAYWHCDVADEAQVKEAIDSVAEKFGKLDVLVNNAGISGTNKPTHQLTEEEWDRVQAVNVKGVFFCTKHAIPHMKKSGQRQLDQSFIHLRPGKRSRCSALPRVERRGEIDDQDRRDDIRTRPDSCQFDSPGIHLDAHG